MVYENFYTDYTEIDPDNELRRNELFPYAFSIDDQDFNGASRLYKDFGEDYFNGDFIHQFNLNVSLGDEPLCGTWALANTPSGHADFGLGDVLLRIEPEFFWFKLTISTNLGGLEDDSAHLEFATLYAILIERVGSEYRVTITNVGTSEVIDTLIIDPGVVTSFRYLYMQYEYID